MNKVILTVLTLYLVQPALGFEKLFGLGVQQSYVTNTHSHPLTIHQSYLRLGVGHSWLHFGVELGQSYPWRESQGNLASESYLNRFGFWTSFRALKWQGLDFAWELGTFFSEVRVVQKWDSAVLEGKSGFMSHLRLGPIIHWRFSERIGTSLSYQLENTPVWGNLINQSLLVGLFLLF